MSSVKNIAQIRLPVARIVLLIVGMIQFMPFRVALAEVNWAFPQEQSTNSLPDDFFQTQIRPIFESHCFECHSGENGSSGFRLDAKQPAFAGGTLYGPAIHPNDPDESPLWNFVSDPDADLPMPPDGPRLSEKQLQHLRLWIQSGAPWPDGLDAEVIDKRDHWSFKPVVPVDIPEVRDPGWPRNEIDFFVLNRLEDQGLQPTTEADRRTWLRRVTWDLTGLPPTLPEYRDFVDDLDPEAYEKVVDRLLSSPHYGPRWAQHWLDVVRYADTHGFEVNTERPHAWPYRDYVIRAFQEDLPYNRFVEQQIKGDLEGEDAATGFLISASVLLPGQIGQDEPSKRLARQDALDEIVANVSQSFLALSVGCARCHDHRFDAISQQDYFAWQALVAGVEYEDRPWRGADGHDSLQQVAAIRKELEEVEQKLLELEPLATPINPTPINPTLSDSGPLRAAVQATRNVDRFLPQTVKRLRFTIQRTNQYEPCLDELQVWNLAGENIGLADSGVNVKTSGDRVSPGTHERRFINDGQFGNSSSWMADATEDVWVEYQWDQPQSIQAVVWGRDRTGGYADRLAIAYRIEVQLDDPSEQWICVADHTDRVLFSEAGTASDVTLDETQRTLQQKRKNLENQVQQSSQVPMVFGGRFREPDKIFLLRRGNPELPVHEVLPSTLSFWQPVSVSTDAGDAKRRQMLASWLTDSQHPLTARVAVNRIWQGHFGKGIVATPSDFGRNGQAPSHPELLDWLAAKFVASGWSIKSLHRLIVLSSTYRQSGRFDPQAAQIDADVRWLWRFPTRRLEAEAIRDGMLFVAGQLDESQGGSGFNVFHQRGGLSGFTPIESLEESGKQRMIFAHKVRRERESVFGSFDCPDAGQSTATRRISTTPLQALSLWNSRFSIEVAREMASLIQQNDEDLGQHIRLAWLKTLNREPDEREAVAALEVARLHGLSEVCRVLFNSNEFLYLP